MAEGGEAAGGASISVEQARQIVDEAKAACEANATQVEQAKQMAANASDISILMSTVLPPVASVRSLPLFISIYDSFSFDSTSIPENPTPLARLEERWTSRHERKFGLYFTTFCCMKWISSKTNISCSHCCYTCDCLHYTHHDKSV